MTGAAVVVVGATAVAPSASVVVVGVVVVNGTADVVTGTAVVVGAPAVAAADVDVAAGRSAVVTTGAVAADSHGDFRADIEIALVDYTGTLAQGRLRRGDNPVLMTMELVLEAL